MKHNLPDKNANGFVTLSDFYPHQHETIETALKTAHIPHQIEFYVDRDGAFRVYVPAEYVDSGIQLCIAIEGTVVF